MSRALRIKYEDAWYHIMNRGAGKKNIFHSKKYYNLFLKLLNEIHDRYQIKIHAYCLMPNHYHLLINTPLSNISKAMKYLNGVYTQHHNKLQKTDGPLFRGRFKSILIDANEYLLTLSRYIHLNPVTANIVKFPEQYKWSSYAIYLQSKPKPSWLTTKITLAEFGSKLQIQKYQAFINAGLLKNKSDDTLNKTNLASILGTDEFIKTVIKKHLGKGTKLTQPIKTPLLPTPKITTIMQIVTNYYNIKISELQTKSQGKNKNKPRAVAIYLSCLLSNQTLQHIADKFTNTSYHGVSKTWCRIKQELINNITLDNEIKILKKLISSDLSVVDT